MRSSPVKRSCLGGRVTRWTVDFKASIRPLLAGTHDFNDYSMVYDWHDSPLLHRIIRSPTFITIASFRGGTSMNTPGSCGFSIYWLLIVVRPVSRKLTRHLKASAVILKQHSDRSPIAMSAHSGRQMLLDVGCWNRWIMQQTKLIVMPWVSRPEMVLVRKPNPKCHGA